MSPPLRIVLAEDHALVRQGMCALLSAQPDIEVVGEVSIGSDVLDIVRRKHPDVLVLDLMMPGSSGFDTIRRVTQKVPGCRVLVLSMHASAAYAAEALRCGASGYVLKASDASSLLRGIREVAAGRRYLSPLLSQEELDRYAQVDEQPGLDPFDTLTDRERQVMAMVAQGMTSGAIAELLLISPRTVELHRANLLRKLGVKNHSALVLYALKKGMIPLDANAEVIKPPRPR